MHKYNSKLQIRCFFFFFFFFFFWGGGGGGRGGGREGVSVKKYFLISLGKCMLSKLWQSASNKYPQQIFPREIK